MARVDELAPTHATARRAEESPSVKVALLCSGLGKVNRGFERLIRELFDGLKDEVDLTLFKGAGEVTERERVVFNLGRQGRLVRILPVHRLLGKSPYYAEAISFVLAVWPALIRGKFDVVHYIDIPIGQVLGRMRRRLGGRFRLLYTQGAVVDPELYPAAEHVHQVAPKARDDALAYGIPPDTMTMIPCGLYAETFASDVPREELRRRQGADSDAFLVLSVCAVDRVMKRVDVLIEEVARLDDGVHLRVDGHMEDPSLASLGRERLGERFRVDTVPRQQLSEVYGMADLFVLASLGESFGLAVVEAMAAGLPVLVHDDDHFRWLVEPEEQRVDMARPGALAERINWFRERPEERRRLGEINRQAVRERFDWAAILPRYRDMYRAMGRVSP